MTDELWESEEQVAEAIGRLIEFWGFKRNMGRIWTVLYLSDAPLPAVAIQSRLSLSAGTVSMTLKGLLHWGVAHRAQVEGERREYYAPERDIWKMVSRVYAEREREEVLHAIDTMNDAIEFTDAKSHSPNEEDRRRAEAQLPRIRELLRLSHTGLGLINALVQSGRVDMSSLIGLTLPDSSAPPPISGSSESGPRE